MTDTGPPATASTNPPARSCLRKKRICLIVVLIFSLVAAGGFFCPWLLRTRAVVSPDPSQIDQKLAGVEQQIQSINNRLDDVNARMSKETASPSAAQNEENPASAKTLARIQSDMTTLSSVVAGLQVEVKHAGNAVAATQQAAQSSLASAIAFIQLRAATEAGRGFVTELAVLRRTAPDDNRFHEILENLKPYADKGPPTLTTLREEFMDLEAPASAAIDRSVAQNWWQRIRAELKGLVSIRPLHGGGAADALTTAENALDAGHPDEAVAAVKTLPQDAQDILRDWLAKIQARMAVDASLRELSDRFAALAGSPSTPNSRDEP